MTTALSGLRVLATLGGMLALLACSNGRGSLESGEPQQSPSKVTIGGTVSGLAGSGLVLQNNGGDDLSVNAEGSFSFKTAVDPGSPYNVTIRSQPTNPAQACTLANPSGTATTSNVTTVVVSCATGSFSIGGTIAGLVGSGLILKNNGADDLAIASNGSFTFATELPNGSAYEVSVAAQPNRPAQTCSVADATGTLVGADVRTVKVSCSTNTYPIRGVVSGLQGSGLVLQNNGGDDIGVESSGAFAFPGAVASGAAFSVTVKTQPVNPTQACSVQNGAGTVQDRAIEDVIVACSTSEFSVGGTIRGLAGSGLVLVNNGSDALNVTANGAFTFPTAVLSGRPYNVSVAAAPTRPLQLCQVSNGSGVVGSGNVVDVAVSCITIGFGVGGAVSGLFGTGLKLQNDGGEPFEIAANGAFMLPLSLPQGSPYNISVAAQPTTPTQACTVANATGTIGSTDIDDVAVSCVTSRYTIGGTITGLRGFGLSLRLNGGEAMFVNDNGGFNFPTALTSGSSYQVSVASQPFFPVQQTCIVENAAGTLGGENVTTVLVSCDR